MLFDWRLVNLAMWGTAGMVLHSDDALAILDAIDTMPLAPHDQMLFYAGTNGSLAYEVSDVPIVYPMSVRRSTLASRRA